MFSIHIIDRDVIVLMNPQGKTHKRQHIKQVCMSSKTKVDILMTNALRRLSLFTD